MTTRINNPRLPDQGAYNEQRSLVNEITRLLNSLGAGERDAAEKLSTVIYDELRAMARVKMARESPGQTIQATALVHEAWIRLSGDRQQPWKNRRHFFKAASEAMRRILIDRARWKNAEIHGGKVVHADVDEPGLEIASPSPNEELLAVHEALRKFEEEDPEKAELVKLRYFVGMTIEEAAEALNIGPATAKRHWAFARAWLFREIKHSSQTALGRTR